MGGLGGSCEGFDACFMAGDKCFLWKNAAGDV